ncbi:hypothetical protein [Candidatus Phytoplasma phoenicium]|uniref:Uncharacterized protein n=1 Tax=Candidatus Phytoplasma phoenicium TaxID=198422 RepID=A0A0L0ML33_9MOLU|nr:hypothetical protein [Candidatus Phytoplasma phoenicium]KND62709.1 hypothetical protein AlmWB_00980 [Candidatus Phytoplasma phoenicium]
MITNHKKIIRLILTMVTFIIIFCGFYWRWFKNTTIEIADGNQNIREKIEGKFKFQELKEKLNKKSCKIYTNQRDSQIIYYCHNIKYMIKPKKNEAPFFVEFYSQNNLLNDKWYLDDTFIGTTFKCVTNNHPLYCIEFQKDRWFLQK